MSLGQLFDGWSVAVAPYVLGLIAAALLCTLLAVLGWRRRTKPGGLEFVAMMIAAAVWAFLYALELTAPTLAGKLVWAKGEYFGIVALPLTWFFFARSHTDGQGRWDRWLLALAGVVPVVTVVFAVTNGLHGWLWSQVSLDTSGLFPALALEHGPWFWVHMVYSYALLALGSFLLFRAVYRYPHIYRQQAGMLMIAALAPWVGNILFISGLRPAGNIDVTPFAFAITGVALAFSMSRLRLFTLLPALFPAANNRVRETMKDGVVVLDVDGRVVSVNPAAGSILRGQSPDPVGRQLSEVLGESVAARLVGDQGPDSQFEICLGEGPAESYYDVVSSPIGVGGGIGLGRLLVIRDITGRKKAEAQLRRSEARYRGLNESLRDGFASTDLDGRVREFNEAFRAMLGYEREELLGVNFADLTPERWRSHEAEILRDQVMARGYSDVYEKEYIRADGSILPVELRTTLERDENGSPVAMWAVVRDISERKEAEETLRSSEDRYRQLFELESDAIVLVDNESGQILEANAAAAALYGYTHEEWLSMNHADVSVEPEKTRGAAVGGETQIPLRWHRKKDGEVFPVEITARHFDSEGRSVHIAAIRDVSERVEAERILRERDDQLRQAQKMEAIGQLAGGIAHDFNNLLTAIIGYSDLILASEGCDESASGDVREIKTAANRAAALTRQILAFSRRQALQPEVVCLNDIVTSTERLLRRTLGEDIDLVTLLRPDLGKVEADATQFQQVLMNLALNSRDAMGKGGKLTIETANVELSEDYCRSHVGATPGAHVSLVVTDTGVGMDEETRSRVFEPFFTTKEPGKGTGLGLSTVYGTVKQSGGGVFISSEVGLGTTVKVYLPRVDQPAAYSPVKVEGSTAVSGKETILVVEDERAVRNLATRILERSGYRVIGAENGDDALAVLEDSGDSVDMLLTDVVLPGTMQGNELAQAALLRYPRLPVLYMSGYPRDAIVHAGRLDEGVNYLEKPFTPDGLSRRVREVLDGRHPS